MLKASGQDGLGQPLLFLGITGENVTRLVAGEPIRIRPEELRQLGLYPMNVVIAYAKTDDGLVDLLESHGIRLRNDRIPGRDA